MDLTLPPEGRRWRQRALDTACTTLEALFWGTQLGMPGAWRLYLEELIITPLDDGPGDVPDEFVGEPNTPHW